MRLYLNRSRLASSQNVRDGQEGLQRISLCPAGRRHVRLFVAGPSGEIEDLADDFARDTRAVVADNDRLTPEIDADHRYHAGLLTSVQ